MDVYKRIKKLNEMDDNLKIIELSKDILTGIMKTVTKLTNEFVDIDRHVYKKELDNEQKLVFLERYEKVLCDVDKLKKEALNAGISKFGLWLRRNKMDKTLLYISNYCKKALISLKREHKKITNEMRKLFFKDS